MSPRARIAQENLQASQKRKFEWWILRLTEDVFAGDQIPTDGIPPALATRSSLSRPPSNAWRFELPLACRGIYTVQSHPGIGIVVLMLETLSHKEYDRLFGYR